MQSKNALGNLKNRYLAVLKKCNLINVFGSLAVVGMLTIGAGSAFAIVVYDGSDVTESHQTNTVSNATITGLSAYGGQASSSSNGPKTNGGVAEANSNTLTYTGGDDNLITLYGGKASSDGMDSNSSAGDGNLANANNNTVIMEAGIVRYVYGGEALSFGGTNPSTSTRTGDSNIATANNNKVTIKTGATIYNKVYGGSAESLGVNNAKAEASNNTVIIESGAVVGSDVYGGVVKGNTNTSEARGNIVHIYGEVGEYVYGAFSPITGAIKNGNIGSYNKVYIHDGATINKDIYGGSGFNLSQYNTISLNGNINLNGPVGIYGTLASPGSDNIKGNTLILDKYTTTQRVDEVGGVEIYNFILPANTVANSTVLLVNQVLFGGADAIGRIGSVSIEKGHNLPINSTITLIEALILGDNIANNGQIVTSDTSTFTQQEWKINQDNTNNDITATFLSESLTPTSPPTGSGGTLAGKVAEAQSVVGVGVAKAAGQSFASMGLPAAQTATENVAITQLDSEQGLSAGSMTMQKGIWAPFATMYGGYSSFDSGSETDVASLSFMGGLAHTSYFDKGSLMLGAFFETGTGSYDSTANSGGARIDSDGNLNYYGAGIFGRYDFYTENGTPYLEASARLGSINSDYDTNDIIDSTTGSGVNYETNAMYYGLHVGAGHIFQIAPQWKLDLSAKYFWTHHESVDEEIGGNRFDFDSINSHVARLGAKVTYDAVNNGTYSFSPYAGFAYEYEFDSNSRASVDNIPIPSEADLQGSTAVLELGAQYKHINGVTLSAGVEGSLGKREGVSGKLEFTYEF